MAFNRVIILVDMDCFYVQVEQRRDPSTRGKPCAVVQYKKYKGGGIIAVGYEARACGVTRRGMMGDEAKAICPEINIFRVPESNGKANLDRYREAGAEVINVLSQFGGRVERASIDEAYIDFTDVVNKIIAQKKEQEEYLTPEKLTSTHIVGWPEEIKEDEDKEVARAEGVKHWLQDVDSNSNRLENARLTIAAVLTEEIRAAVYHQTGFRCSAGISYNKMLSKLACGINKPNKQTILPQKSVPGLFKTMKIDKIRNLGGKLGKTIMTNFEIEFMSQLGEISMDKLIHLCGTKNACWIKEVCNGVDHEPVKERHVAQSIGCGKNFLGPDILNTKAKVKAWMDALLMELSERLEKDKAGNNRIARTLSVHVKLETGQSLSRSGPLLKYGRTDLLKQCLHLIRLLDSASSQDERWRPGIISLSVNAKKFDPIGGSIFPHTSPTKVKPNPATENKPVKLETSSGLFSGFMNDREVQCKVRSDHDASGQTNQKPKEVTNDAPSVQFFSKMMGSQSGHLALKVNSGHRTCEKAHTQLKELAEDSPFKGFSKTNKSEHNEQHSVDDNAIYLSTRHVAFENEDRKPPWLNNGLPIENDFSKATRPLGKLENQDSSSQDCDIIFVGEQHSSVKPRNLFSKPKVKPSGKKGICKIDAMLLKERETILPKTQNYDLPDGPVFHPLYGEIDKEVFRDLPLDIQKEIAKSYKITTSVIPSSQSPSSSQKTYSKNKDRNQRLMSNFIPLSQNTPPINNMPVPSLTEKRKSTDPGPIRTKKQKAKSPSTRKSPSSKSKAPVFASTPQNDVMPLGFFRQRTQLSDAISKALTKGPPKFFH